MNKVEFIDMLRRHITEVGDPAFINDTVDYYRDYIDTAIRKGRTEEDVLAELGDPRLIAKSIVASRDDIPGSSQSHSGNGSASSEHFEGEGYYGGSADTEDASGRLDYGIYDGKFHLRTRRGKEISLPLGLVKVGGAAAAILLLLGAGYVAVSLLPVIGFGILAVLIYRFFKDNF